MQLNLNAISVVYEPRTINRLLEETFGLSALYFDV